MPPTMATAGGGSPAGGGLGWGGGGGGTIGGYLPFEGMGAAANMDFSGNPAALSASYANSYNAALGLNSANYRNILSGYQQTAGNLNAATQQVAGGYGALQEGVLGDLSNAGATQRQAINDTYAREQGSAMQSLINRGLGNTTIQQGVQRGLIYDREKANVSLAEQIANLKASYRSNLGLAGLQYQGQAALQNAAQSNQQLQWMNSVQAPYPDASAYAKLAEMYGASQQAEENRNLQRSLMGGGGQMMGGGYSGIRGSAFGPSWGSVTNPETPGGSFFPLNSLNLGGRLAGGYSGGGSSFMGDAWNSLSGAVAAAPSGGGNSFMGDAWSSIDQAANGYGGGGDWGGDDWSWADDESQWDW